ncbi:hypothetical protein H2200_000963 [Cladophialophora chaetospira]|uniref:Uncharacterized protein n=1 Tax=Cladophialophora chaetospira TaxID=386627 RepID=A0AA38XPK0_9EURO|nr:hypothetical protein H2200_000963 [Cladophialophora chaetospira]
MATKGEAYNNASQWTPEQMEVLCNALDEIARGKSTTLDRIAEYIEVRLVAQLQPPESQPSKSEIVYKIRELARQAEVTPSKLVQEWVQRRASVKNTIQLPSASPEPRSRKRRRLSTPSMTSTRSSGAPKSLTAPAQRSGDDSTSNVEHSQDQGRRVERSPEGEDEETDTSQGESQQFESIITKKPKGKTSLATRDYVALQRELLDTWRYSAHNHRFSETVDIDHAELAFDAILRHIKTGVAAFCEAQPFEELTANKLTPATVELAKNMVFAKDRDGVQDILKALFGDPFLSKEIALRAFAAAAVTHWAFNSQLGTLPDTCPATAKTSIGGFPQLVEALEVEDQLAYLDKVVRPALPGLARRYQNDLFDIFRSLRAPLAPSDPWRSSEPQETSPEGGWLMTRYGHQTTFEHSLEQAFLTALNFRLHIATTDRSEEEYSIRCFQAGSDFDADAMTVNSSQTTDRAQFLAGNPPILVCLCPAIWRTISAPDNTHSGYVLKALVMMEGWDIDDELDGYPRDRWYGPHTL